MSEPPVSERREPVIQNDQPPQQHTVIAAPDRMLGHQPLDGPNIEILLNCSSRGT